MLAYIQYGWFLPSTQLASKGGIPMPPWLPGSCTTLVLRSGPDPDPGHGNSRGLEVKLFKPFTFHFLLRHQVSFREYVKDLSILARTILTMNILLDSSYSEAIS